MSAVQHTESQGKASKPADSGPVWDANPATQDLISQVAVADSGTRSMSASGHGNDSPRQCAVEVDVDAIAKIASEKVLWKVASVACWVIGIAIIVIPARMSIEGTLDSVFTPPPGFSGGWIGFVVKHWPSCILFLLGKIASDASRR